MAFEGNLATLSFADLLQLLGSTRKTGTLVLTLGTSWKKLFLRDGLILGVSSNDPDEFVSHTLVSMGKIKAEDMHDALARQHREGRLLGQILVDEGKLKEEVLRRYLADRAYEMVAKVMAWSEAGFRFEEFVLPSQDMVGLDLSVEGLLMEAFRRIDEVDRFRSTLPGRELVLEKTGETPGDDLLDQTVVGLVFRKLDEPRSVKDLRKELRATEFNLLEGVRKLIESGVLRWAERRAAPPAPPPPAGWLQEGRKLFLAGLHEEAVETLRRGLAHEPDNAEARELLGRAEERLVREVTLKELPLDAVPQLVAPLEQFADRSLSPAEAYILTRVNGETAVGLLLETTPLPESEILLTLRRLVRSSYIRVTAVRS